MAINAVKIEDFFAEMKAADSLVSIEGKLTSIGPKGLIATGLSHVTGLEDFVSIKGKAGDFTAEVVFVDQDQIIAKPLDADAQIYLGDTVRAIGKPRFFPTNEWKGRLINAIAEPLDGKGPLPLGPRRISYAGKPVAAVDRAPITRKLVTGVKAVDVFTPICYGQRMGIFAGSGVGKSTLMGMLAASPGFDVAIIALVGERGREVTEFIHEVLGDTLQKSIVIIATGDESASMRKRAALLATSLAEWYRDEGQNVLLMMDSLTRYAQALRELALAGGEPPVSRGFPPSVFSAIPQILERSGPGLHGSGTITGIFSVLVEGDNHNEPIADAVRGTLDGHIILDRRIGGQGRFPAMDLLQSISRLQQKAHTPEQAKTASELRKLVHRYEDSRDLRALGGYTPGKDPDLDRALNIVPKLYTTLMQTPGDGTFTDAFSTIALALQPPPKQ
ncbi:FliI/YscN family ATPase [Aestuariivirga litoralis]|uniref:FliI/YscN family ATPase n=1 Tax=Aestuariivirga litoralis TaxID=2650924 RepID=UPI0018C6FA27|nr:FliI/YscN family ATPase [Aestuariivirga litoralis]MBG1233207.1 FliI/YscN family ATPase [Aestuariivirga litoralis]